MTTDELYQAQMENRFLKETIAALREELEKERICRDDDVQKALADAHDNIKQLKETVSSLRLAMEKMAIEHDKDKQKIIADSHE